MFNKVRKAVKKRYVAKSGGRKSTGGIRVAKMAKDIMYLKSVLNPEKRRFATLVTSQPVGQIDGNGDGRYFEDVTPVISQGLSVSGRSGSSIKLHSTMWHFQFQQQASTLCKIRGIIEIWAMEKEPYSGFTFFNEHWNINPFISGSIRDYNAPTNPDNYMKGKCIARRKFSVNTDQLGNERLTTDVKIPVLYNKGQGKHIRYNADTNTVEYGQMYLVVRLDRGNMSNINIATLSGVPDLGVNTGLNMSYNKVDYWYDN